MKPGKKVLTTGQVAKLCNVAPRTVSKWFDQGHLRGYRIPGSKDRRIPLDQLIKFMRENGMPLQGLDIAQVEVLLMVADSSYGETLSTTLRQTGGFDVTTTSSAIEAGAALQSHQPSVFVVDTECPDLVPETVVRFLKSSEGLSSIRVIGIGSDLDNGHGEQLMQTGFAGYLLKPFQTRQLIDLIESIIENQD